MDGVRILEKTADNVLVVFDVLDYGEWTVSALRDDLPSDTVTVIVDAAKQSPITLAFFTSTITVTVESGSTIVCEGGGRTQTKISDGSVVFTVTSAATYTITDTTGNETTSGTVENTASMNGRTTSGTVQVTTSGQTKTLSLAYVRIYGVSWDSSSTTKLSRIDDAELFADPAPAVGTGAGFSPFDDCYPWNGTTKVTDGNNILVKIPKYWVKVSHNPFRVQIADKPSPGYQVSPAHRDGGAGFGERDQVYIGCYECDSSYQSRSGQATKVSTTLAAFRTGIAALGAEHWQADFALQLTWWYLCIVEFADWSGQTAMGKGNSYSNKKINTGGTDSMTYHTGRAAGTDGKVSVQYRNMENPWGNVLEWRDGIIFSNANICTYNNPADFKDTYNGEGAAAWSNKRVTSGGFIKAWGYDTSDESFIYPSTVGGSQSPSVPDYCYYVAGVRALCVGGSYLRSGDNAGPFFLYGNNTPGNTNSNLGSRLLIHNHHNIAQSFPYRWVNIAAGTRISNSIERP